MSAFREIDLAGMQIADTHSEALLDHIFASLENGHGGWVVTANLDIIRRFALDPDARALYAKADLRVADGMPLVWASKLQGDPLPERVAGSLLIWALAERAAQEGRSLYLLGGAPGAALGSQERFAERWPEIDVCGVSAPFLASPPTAEELRSVAEDVVPRKPDLLLVGFGSPKQEQVIEGLREALPGTWMMGVGISFSFVSGEVQTAPPLLRRIGFEWAHRMLQEPRRLARRYLLENAPFAIRLFAGSLQKRFRKTRHD